MFNKRRFEMEKFLLFVTGVLGLVVFVSTGWCISMIPGHSGEIFVVILAGVIGSVAMIVMSLNWRS
jgi:hypothetical protein